MSERKGDWMQRAKGMAAWPLSPSPDDFRDICEIAFVFAGKNRFNGHAGYGIPHTPHTPRYNVADHCVRVSRIVPPEHALQALLHEGDEFLLPDVPRPLKIAPEMAWYRALCREHRRCMYLAWDLPEEEPACVKQADEILLATEARDLMGGESAGKWNLIADPLPERIDPLSPYEAELAFVRRFLELFNARQR